MRATPIPQRSRAQVRARDFSRCVRCYVPAATGEWHHRRGRSARDAHTHHPCNGIWLCKTCHDWVHGHPFDARTNGWIVARNVKEPGSVPYLTPRGWALASCDGNARYAQAASLSEAIESFNR